MTTVSAGADGLEAKHAEVKPQSAPQPRIASLGHVGIFVTDLDRSLAFYRDLLGLAVTDNDETNGMIFLCSRPEEEHHEFLICRGRHAEPGVRLIQQISFRCATLGDVVGFWERLKDAGVEFDRIVSHGNAVGVYFFDPDRNRCEVYWPTGFKARQTFLAHIDLTQPVDALMTEIKSVVDRYGETGYVDPRLLRN
jgi:catechol 2,3-dioxygenase-like lactoylglutathione lyase family enzyme